MPEIRKDENIHTSVLLHELVSGLNIDPEKKNIVVDGTLGYGGHALAVIEKMSSNDIFIGFDADAQNLEAAKKRIQTQIQGNIPTLIFIHSNFSNLREQLLTKNIESITALYYDLGVSSMHFDEADRGFSLRSDGPLDMRFDASQGIPASQLIENVSENDLSEILWKYGEEKAHYKIARAIKSGLPKTTLELKKAIESISQHPKTALRVFQALRIAVNNELETLESSLQQGIQILSPGGRLAVISFHSLEDRIVKHIIKQETRDCICDDLICSCHHVASLKNLTKKPILPSEKEQKENRRSRSAKLRIAEKKSS